MYDSQQRAMVDCSGLLNNAGRFRAEVSTSLSGSTAFRRCREPHGFNGSSNMSADIVANSATLSCGQRSGSDDIVAMVDSNLYLDNVDGKNVNKARNYSNSFTPPTETSIDRVDMLRCGLNHMDFNERDGISSAGLTGPDWATEQEAFLSDMLPYAPESGSGSLLVKPKPAPVHLENPERETRWYFKYFLGKYHQLYCGHVTERDPFLLAVAKTDVQSYGVSQYRAILWRKTGSQKLCISHNPTSSLTAKKVLNFFDLHRIEKGPREIINFEVQKDALTIEEQEIERKRHVGNDIVNIVFIDAVSSDALPTWTPSMMKTHFTHIFAIVTYYKDTGTYRLNVFAEESVPVFGPPVPNPPEFPNPQEFREFLLVKLINGEKAAFHSPVFAEKRERTLETLLHMIAASNMNDPGGGAVCRRALSDVVMDSFNGITTGKERNRHDSFIHFGQPWQAKHFHTTFQYEVICCDAWGDNLIVGTEMGTFLLKEHNAPILLIDRSADVKQIQVTEHSELLILRHDKGRESRVAVVPLTNRDFGHILDRAHLKKWSLERSKGCQMFALSKCIMQPLKIAMLTHKRIVIYQWQIITGHSLSSWNQIVQINTLDNLQFVRELPLIEPIQTICFVEGLPGGRLCIGHRNQFDLIDEKTREIVPLFRADSSRNQVVAAHELWEEDEAELLLCFTRTCHIQKLSALQWDQSPAPTTRRLQTMHSSCSDSPMSGATPPHNRLLATSDSGASVHTTANTTTTTIGSSNNSTINMGATSPNASIPITSTIHTTTGGVDVAWSLNNHSHPHNLSTQSNSPTSSNLVFPSSAASQAGERSKLGELEFTWNFEPEQVVVSQPYIFAFTPTSIELRLKSNGSLVHTMLVPGCRLIASKTNLYFVSTSDNLDMKCGAAGHCMFLTRHPSTSESILTHSAASTTVENKPDSDETERVSSSINAPRLNLRVTSSIGTSSSSSTTANQNPQTTSNTSSGYLSDVIGSDKPYQHIYQITFDSASDKSDSAEEQSGLRP